MIVSLSKTSFTVANISWVLKPPAVKSGTVACMAEGTEWISPELFHFSLSPFFSSSFSAAHKRSRPVCDVVEEHSQNELITDEGRRAFETWHRATFFKRLKIVTVGFLTFVFLIGSL